MSKVLDFKGLSIFSLASFFQKALQAIVFHSSVELVDEWYNCYTGWRRVRFKFDENKSGLIKSNPKRGIDFNEVQEVWSHPYYEDFRNDDPEQFRVIGWAKGKLYSVIFEVREDAEGEFIHLITLWKATKEEIKLYESNV